MDELLRAALDASPDACVAVDVHGVVRLLSPVAAALLGHHPDAVVGGRDPSIPATHREADADAIRRVAAGEAHGADVLVPRVTADGDLVVVHVVGATPVTFADGTDGVLRWFREADDGAHRRMQLTEAKEWIAQAATLREALEATADAAHRLLGTIGGLVLDVVGPDVVGRLGLGLDHALAQSVRAPLAELPGLARVLEHGGVGRAVLPVAEATVELAVVRCGPDDRRRLLALLEPDDRAVGPSAPGREGVAQALANELHLAMDRFDLVDELEVRVEVLEALALTAELFGRPLGEIAEGVAALAADALSCERVALHLVAEDGTVDRQVTLDHGEITTRPGLGDDLVAAILAAGTTRRWGPGATADLPAPWGEQDGAVSVLALPLRLGDRVLGVLVLAHTTAAPRGFTRVCLEVGEAIAGQAALGVADARLQADLVTAAGELHAANERRRLWTAGVSHDLRSPMAGLLGFLDLLAQVDHALAPDERAAYVEAMRRQARRIMGIVDDVLLAAGAEMREIEGGDDVVDLPATVHGIVSELPPEDAERVEVEVHGPAVVVARRRHVERIAANLVRNALHHGGGARVRLVVREHAHLGSLEVRDHGPGVEEYRVAHLFDAFARGRDSPGSGLGLAISRDLARANDGDLTYEAADPGASFVLWLPAAHRSALVAAGSASVGKGSHA